jgi:photosystem II stability/assembly factor-like uncharacterized protein
MEKLSETPTAEAVEKRFHDLQLYGSAGLRIGRIAWIAALVVWSPGIACAQSPSVVRPALLEKPAGAAFRAPSGALSSSFGSSRSSATVFRVEGVVRTQRRPIPWYVSSMKLLAPGVGWAQTGRGLLWTEDDGKNWKNITPHQETALPEPFFLDPHHGWMMSVGCSAENPKKLEMGFNLVSTADSGATWSSVDVSPLTVTNYGNSDGADVRGCGGDFAFVDSLRGWINVTARGVTMDSFWAFLLTTSDGGRTWKRAAHAPSLPDGQILLVTPGDGWLLGGPADGRLFATHDGTNSWLEVKVDRPNDISKEASLTSYPLPTFQDGTHGFLPVTYSGVGVDVKSTTVLFSTDDGGRSWRTDRMVTSRQSSKRYRKSAMIGSDWIFVAIRDHRPVLEHMSAGEKFVARDEVGVEEQAYKQPWDVSFVTAGDGWVTIGDGELLSTTDGGSTWTDITPGLKTDALLSTPVPAS